MLIPIRGLEHRRGDSMSNTIMIDVSLGGYNSAIRKSAAYATSRRVAAASGGGLAVRQAKRPPDQADLDSRFLSVTGGNSEPNSVDSPGAHMQAHCARRILLVEDDLAMRHMVAAYLREHNFRIASVANRQDATRSLSDVMPDLVLLDLVLGEEHGLDLLREIRSESDVPAIIIIGHRCNEADRVIGLELGADHYVTKPFNVRELLARIRAVLRRRDAQRLLSERKSEPGVYRFGSWKFDRHSRQLSTNDGVSVALTKGEYALLVAFLERPHTVLGREHLLQATRMHEDVFDRSIDVQILRLRRKLEVDPSNPQIICTERGVGYLFALSVEQL
jgi:two-component system, OmpR family, response regulator